MVHANNLFCRKLHPTHEMPSFLIFFLGGEVTYCFCLSETIDLPIAGGDSFSKLISKKTTREDCPQKYLNDSPSIFDCRPPHHFPAREPALDDVVEPITKMICSIERKAALHKGGILK